MKDFLKLLYQALAIRAICSIFDNDAHRIISKRGLQILDKRNKIVYLKSNNSIK